MRLETQALVPYPVRFDRSHHDALVVLGATATGKTALAVALAQKYQGEIISADSRQVYRGLDVGTGKDLALYGSVPYHLIDVCDPYEEYNVFRFQQAVYGIVPSILRAHKVPIIVGGTGLYLDAVLRQYALVPVERNQALRASLRGASLSHMRAVYFSLKDSHAVHNKTDLEDPARLMRAIEIAVFHATHPELVQQARETRPMMRAKVYGIQYPRSMLRARIRARLEQRIRGGLIEEVAALHKGGVSWQRLEYFGLEYRFTAQYLQGIIATRDEYVDLLFRAISRFAKRQETWFRRMQRLGVKIHWLVHTENGFVLR